MKIDERIRSEYARQRRIAVRLKNSVDSEIHSRKPEDWHYESRIKKVESYALKVECGRPGDPTAVEDFFGCAVVVPNYLGIAQAEQMLIDLYGTPEYQRPQSREETPKEPSDFRFDDLRLYMRYRDAEYGPPTGFGGTLFEVQIRTFLQHAWTIATHDIIYKSVDVSWRRERIAHHAKAALEQAEVTIASVAVLEQSTALPVTSKKFESINETIAVLKLHWDEEQLPTDLRRLATGVIDLLAKLNIRNVPDLVTILEAGKQRYGGEHNLNWSPYQALVQYLSEQYSERLKRALAKPRRDPIFVYPSTLETLEMSPASAPGAVLLGS